jgi:antitoxin (DNA-binding transcriptional repressor) of toxin-antitoxin stability system
MRHVSLREFRTRGAKALADVPRGETTLLVGQNGPAYFLVPVCGDVIKQDKDLRRAMAFASLREGWRLAEESGANLITEEEIEAEIDYVRRNPERKKASTSREASKREEEVCA